MSIVHPITPLYNENSEVLILGSFPSVKSRESGFFYGHPQNRFWKVIASVCGQEIPKNIQEKKELLLSHNIAVWDVIQSCDITGSSDSSIKNVVANDISKIVSESKIEKIYTNGKKAYQLYEKYILPVSYTHLTDADKWILSKVNTLAKDVTENLDKYELGIAADKIYNFIWEEFCDWYIEMVKPRLYNDSDDTKEAALWTLKKVLIDSLKLLHPYMPFVTRCV